MNAVKPDRRTAKRAAGMLLCLLALFAAVPQAGAVNPGARYFTHLKTTDSGLSYNCVHAIIQDSRGFIWLGTSDGLNRYDGMRFRTFHKNELGGNSGFIVSLCEDDRGDIWIGTDSGVVLYDAATDRFRALDTPSDRGTVIHNKVTTIKKDRQGVIWMAVNNQGLFSCDPESGALKNYFVEEGRQTLPANITSFCFDVNNECWLSLYFSNLYHADKALTEATPDPEQGELRHYILRDGKTNRSRACDAPKGDAKQARLRYATLGAGTNYTLVEVELLTGRHHQIRAQLSKIGCPIRGDLKYGARRSLPGGGISLHSRRVEFEHPVRREPLSVTAPVPAGDNLWAYFENL